VFYKNTSQLQNDFAAALFENGDPKSVCQVL